VLSQLDNSDIELSDSDDDIDDDDVVDPTYNPDDARSPVGYPTLEVSSEDEEEEEAGQIGTGTLNITSPLGTNSSSLQSATNQTRKKPEFKWKAPARQPFNPVSISWMGHMDLGDLLESPLKYFSEYFTDKFFEIFADQSNQYYLRVTGNELKTTADEIRRFLGAAAAPQPGDTNKFWKIEPLMSIIRNACRKLPREEHCSVDEQMIPFTGRVPARQFIRSKPNPVGVKNFAICGKSGRLLDFEFYQGAGTGVPEATKHLGLGASVVLRLAQTIPPNQNFKLYFDNYFTSIPLIHELRSKGIHSLGVLKSNRLSGCVLKSEKDLKKEGRGATDSKVTHDGTMTIVRWQDNGAVTLASSFAGIDEQDKVQRWSESQKEYIMVDRPRCVQLYNCNMGGVDNIDRLISLYRIKSKTRKWPVRAIFHFTDLSLSNAWLLYRDQERLHGNTRCLDLLNFRDEVGTALLQYVTYPRPRTVVGRPRSSELMPAACSSLAPKRPKPNEQRPGYDMRYDGFQHWPITIDGLPVRCKLEGCSSRSRVKCEKCQVSLCLTKEKNCFKRFHLK